MEFKKYRRINIAEMRPYIDKEPLLPHVSISKADEEKGSPKVGDMIARNPDNHEDQWLVSKDYFEKNFEEVSEVVVQVPLVDFQHLEDMAYKLQALEEAGVDNWDGYSEAMKIYESYK